MKLIVDNVRTVLTDLTAEERNELKTLLTKKDQRTGFFRGKFDASKVKAVKYYYENKAGILVFTGLLKYIMPVIKDKISSVENKTETYDYQKKDYDYDTLRKQFNPNFKYVEHQIRALKTMLGKSKGIIKATTSAGKTEIIIAFLKLTGLKTLVVGPKVDLCNQLYQRIRKAGLSVGLMTGSSKSYSGENICVATPQMALALADRDFECIICDEAHHSSSATYQDFLKSTKAKIMFGFSATPDTNAIDFLKIKQFFGEIIVEINAQELLENDVITFPNINFVTLEQYNTVDWPSANDICIIHNEERNLKIKELAENNPQPALILIRNIEHGEILNKLIPDSIFLSGRDDNEFRDKTLKNFEEEKVKVLIGTYQVLGEGISVNSIRTLIISQGGKSDVVATQALGRALRKAEGKKQAEVFDFMDIGNKYTEAHSLQRMKTYKKIGFPVNIYKEEKLGQDN